jgi:2-hydroxy-3-keto-5-methylthiopentenyl-1-phosphate phosphatase
VDPVHVVRWHLHRVELARRAADDDGALAGEDFKSRVVADLRARHPGHPAVYVGDGRLDLPAALTCDRIFAVANSGLADLARVAGRTVEEFEQLDEVAASL